MVVEKKERSSLTAICERSIAPIFKNEVKFIRKKRQVSFKNSCDRVEEKK